MARPLDGVVILDFTWALAGPYATMVLADLGAEVIKIERRRIGDMSRGNGPFVDGISTYFFSANRGKKSVTLDLRSAKGKEIVFELVKRADVVTENFVPGTMESLGLGYEALRRHNPAIIYASTSGFGQTGPLAKKPAVDIIAQAMSGMMSITGEEDGGPVRVGCSIGDVAAGLYTAVAILAAIHERSKTGLGQTIDISMLDCQLAIMENAFVRYLNTGEIPRALGTRHPVATPFQAFPTIDGWVVLAMSGGRNLWDLFCAAIDRVDLIDDVRFQTGYARTQNVAELQPIIAEATRQKTTAEWIEQMEAIGIPCAPINRVDQAAWLPQVAAREMIVEVPAGDISMRIVNTPVKMSRTPCSVDTGGPALGEHTNEVLARFLGFDEEELSALKSEGVI